MSTKEILDLYFENAKGTPVERLRVNIDKPVLYEYEKRIQKELIDMDANDLIGLIKAMYNTRDGIELSIITSHVMYEKIVSLLRSIFDFYINNVDIIKNPCSDPIMKGRALKAKLTEGKEATSWSTIEKIINKLHEDLDTERPDYADYIELILLLYYCGFENATEIVTLQESMINHETHTVALSNRTVVLSDRCYELLEKFHNMAFIAAWRGNNLLKSWHNGYFKFIIRPSQEYELDNRTEKAMSERINSVIAKQINSPYHTKINYSTLYWLGFYDFAVSKYGREETDRMFTSRYESDDITKITALAKEYGVRLNSINEIKKHMIPYIDTTD